jgi:hypothetical protein
MLQCSVAPNLPVQFPFPEFVLRLPLRRTASEFPTSGIKAGCGPGSCCRTLHVMMATVVNCRSHLQHAACVAVDTGDERVIERVIEKSSSSGIVYPTLTRTNYTEWSLVMIEDRDDRLEMQPDLAMKLTASAAWEAIRLVRVGADRVKEANAERLRQHHVQGRRDC